MKMKISTIQPTLVYDCWTLAQKSGFLNKPSLFKSEELPAQNLIEVLGL